MKMDDTAHLKASLLIAYAQAVYSNANSPHILILPTDALIQPEAKLIRDTLRDVLHEGDSLHVCQQKLQDATNKMLRPKASAVRQRVGHALQNAAR